MKETGLCLPGVLLRDLCSSPPMTMQGVPAKGTLPLLQKVGYVDMELEWACSRPLTVGETPCCEKASVIGGIRKSFPTSWLPGWEFVFRVPRQHVCTLPAPPPLWVKQLLLGPLPFPGADPPSPHLSLLQGFGSGLLGIVFLAIGWNEFDLQI